MLIEGVLFRTFIVTLVTIINNISLQNQDNQLAQATNTPQVRFVERAGTTLMCQGRAFLAREEEEEALRLVADS